MKIYINLLIVVCLVSCSNIKKLSGKQYIHKSPNRELILNFKNDSLCIIKNIFYCDSIDEQFKEITINTFYRKKNDSIFFKNVNCKPKNCDSLEIFEIPIYNKSDCVFLSLENRDDKILFDGRIIQSEFNKNGLVPNIGIDTMYIIKNKIYFIKKTKAKNIGYIFGPQ